MYPKTTNCNITSYHIAMYVLETNMTTNLHIYHQCKKTMYMWGMYVHTCVLYVQLAGTFACATHANDMICSLQSTCMAFLVTWLKPVTSYVATYANHIFGIYIQIRADICFLHIYGNLMLSRCCSWLSCHIYGSV